MNFFWTGGTLQSDIAERGDFVYTALSETGHFLLGNPAAAICAALLLGVLLGRIKIKGFQFGSALGTLIASLFLSAFFAPLGAFVIDDLLKTLAFSAFVFAIGYDAGPSFFRNLRGQGAKITLLSLVYGAAVLLVSLFYFKILGTGRAEAAGIVAGAATQSAILASAGASLSKDEQSLMAIAYAVTYVFGLIGTLLILRLAVPVLFHADLSRLGDKEDHSESSAAREAETVIRDRNGIPATDLVFLAAGIGLGILIGSFSVKIANVSLSIGSGGGALITGLLFGWYKGKKTAKEPVPPAVSDFMKSVGLCLFMAAVGLVAGNRFLDAIKEMGPMVILVGMGITVLPHALCVLTGKYLLKLPLPSILGGLAGASTCGAALDGLLRDSGNNRSITNSFTIGYAMGNIVLTLLGPILVAVLP